MAEFNYTARNAAGEKVTGTLSADTRGEALAVLSNRELFPLHLEDEAPMADTQRIRRVPARLMAAFYSQTADLLRSGVPLLRCLEVLGAQTSHSGLKAVLGQVHHHVQQGSTLAEAMGRFPRLFSEMATSMVRAGGEGGFLEEALNQVAEFTEAQEDFKRRTLGAIAYPMVLAAVMTVIVVVLMVFFVPMFDELFEGLRNRGELPPLTDLLLVLSSIMQRWFVVVILAATGAGALVWRWLRTEEGRYRTDRAKLRLPMIGTIFVNLAVSRFCRVLGTLLHNGVPILRSLEISSDATGNRVLAEAVREATENISAGESLAAPLRSCGHFPPMVVEMISVAEEANNLEAVLLDIAKSLETRTWRALDLAVRLLEPLLLMLLAGVVLLLALALLLPIMKMSQMV